MSLALSLSLLFSFPPFPPRSRTLKGPFSLSRARRANQMVDIEASLSLFLSLAHTLKGRRSLDLSLSFSLFLSLPPSQTLRALSPSLTNTEGSSLSLADRVKRSTSKQFGGSGALQSTCRRRYHERPFDTSIKSHLWKISSTVGDKCPQNGSKNGQAAPRTGMGYPR